MPKVSGLEAFDGAERKIARLGLSGVWGELKGLLLGFELRVEESIGANSAVGLKQVINSQFAMAGVWRKRRLPWQCWEKSIAAEGTRARVGARVRVTGRQDVSARDLMIIEVVGLVHQVTLGMLDVGVVVVPSEKLTKYLGYRVPAFGDAVAAVRRSGAVDVPLIVLALEHDGPGPALPKKRTRQGRNGAA